MAKATTDAIDQMAEAVVQLRDEMAASNYAAGALMDAGVAEPPVKCKLMETEFWMLLLLMIGTIAGCVEGYFDGNVAAIALTVQGIVYSLYRQLSKSRAANANYATAELAGDIAGRDDVELEDVWVQVEANDRRLESIENSIAELNRWLNTQSPTLKGGAPNLNGQATNGQAVSTQAAAPDGP